MIRPSFCLPATLMALLLASPTAGQDLTGIWTTETGGRYVVRQSGDEFCWSAEPVNVFCGIVVDSMIAGRWLDLPTGPYRGSGRMILRIVSPNRLVKVHQTANYAGTVWIREGAQVAGPVTPAANGPPVLPAGGGNAGPASGSGPVPADLKGGTREWDYRNVGKDFPDVGKRIEFTCRADPSPVEWRALYGTDVYTGDSALCQAAIHAGVIKTGGGTFTIEIKPGQSGYQGSPRNGVTSKDWGAWGVSFAFVPSETRLADVGAPPPTRGTPQPAASDEGPLGWEGVVGPSFRDKPGTRIRYVCPAGGRFLGYVWGTDIYTGDSYPCAAAVHAGAITFAGGPIILEIRPGQGSYTGSNRNGVASGSFGAYPTSFVIVR